MLALRAEVHDDGAGELTKKTKEVIALRALTCKCRPPVAGADVVAEQISAGHKYYNRLVELRCSFRAAADELKRKHFPGLVDAEQSAEQADIAVADLVAAIKDCNAAARRKRATPEDAAALADARVRLKDLRATVKAARAAAIAHEGYQADLASLVVEYQGQLPTPDSTRRVGGHFKTARAQCGVYPGTYLLVEAAVEDAAKKSLGPVRFKRWTGDGTCAALITSPIRWGDALEGNTLLRVEIDPTSPRGHRGHRATFHVRVASDSGKPVWCSIPGYISQQRMPAHDTLIAQAKVIRRQVGVRRHRDPNVPKGAWRPYYEWSVQFTLRDSIERPRGKSGACGINFGWRVMDDGTLRVATIVGDDGHEECVCLPASLVARWDKCRDIASIRSKRFDAIKARLAEWMRCNQHPEWLAEMTAALPQWRSTRRLGGVVGAWLAQRLDGDAAIVAELVEWRVKDTHLEQYELTNRSRAERKRLLFYRELRNRLAVRYKTLLLDSTDYRQMRRLPRADSNEAVNETARYNSGIASPGLLRRLMVEAGGIVAKTDKPTATCSVCGHVNTWDRMASVSHLCDGCGIIWDQDVNHAKNLLASGGRAAEGSGAARGAEGEAAEGIVYNGHAPVGKWAKRKADRSRRVAQAGAAHGV